MRTIAQWLNDIRRRGGASRAPAAPGRALTDSELDHVAGGGGKTGASTNPVGD